MSIFKRPAEDVETERARMMARVDARGHEETLRRIQRNAERQDRADEKARIRREKAEKRRQKRADRAESWRAFAKVLQTFADSMRQKLTLILPLLLVNAFAVVGQAGWAGDHLHWQLVAAAGFAATLESIALYVGYHAHAALMAGDSATKLRLASYSIGAVIGGINYDHYAGKNGDPTAMAVIFGLLSLISPWLWAMHGRYKNRRRLEQLGLIDERAPHFSAAKWLHFPVQTFGALRYGVAHNLKDPAAAWEGYQRQRAARAEVRRLERERRRLERDRRPAVRLSVVRVQTVKVPVRKERVKLYWVPDLSGLTVQSIGSGSGSGSGPHAETQTGPGGRSETRSLNGSGGGSRTQTFIGSETRTQTGPESGSRTQVPENDGTGSETSTGNGSETGPRKRSRSRSKTRSKKQVPDRLAEAVAADKAYFEEHGRRIPAEKLAKALSIGKPAALDLVKQVRGGHIDVAK